MRSDSTLKRYYRRYNEKYFGGTLPRLTVIRWSTTADFRAKDGGMSHGDMGVAWLPEGPVGEATILINSDLREQGLWRVIRGTVLHEMVHVALHPLRPTEDHHGRKFKREMRRLVAAGAYDGLL